MTMHGETIATGAELRCEHCGRMPYIDVYRSGAGFCVGTYCNCGPYSRESGYYSTREDAQLALQQGSYGR